jgi:F-type H+-transporting ATPase subunit epsilon
VTRHHVAQGRRLNFTRSVQQAERHIQGDSVANQLHVKVVAVEQRVWSGEAEMLVARTTEGEIGVLPGHAPLLGLLKEPSQVRVKLAGGEQLTYDVAGGFLSIDADGVTVLAESATPATPETH